MQNNPFIGPRPFERVDRINFFGRTRETRDLLSLIMAERVVLFYAQSGAGKTSLLNTQIIPALEDEGFYVLPVVRVGSDLPPDMPQKLVKNIFVFSAWMGLVGKETPLTTLTGTNLESALNAWLLNSPLDEVGELRPPVLIIDQFEEILTTHRDRWQDARGFFEQLAQALTDTPKLGVVLAMREDHVAGLDPYALLLPRRLKARFRMEQLKVDGALEAVKKPAFNAGHPFADGVAEKLVDDLRRLRVAQGEQAPEAAVLGPYTEPVQLQVVCRRLWENLPDRPVSQTITAEDVEQFGNVDRALTDFYEGTLHQVLEEAKPLGQEQGWNVREGQLRRWFGKQLITPMQTRGLVMRGSDTTGDLPNPVVDLIEARHLIRADVRAGARWYEISHDRLVEPIVRANAEWEQTGQSPLHRAAQRWVDSGKNPDLLYRGDTLKKGQEFAEANRDSCETIDFEFLEESQKAQAAVEREQRQHRLIRRLAIGALIALALASAAGIFAFRERDRANNQAQVAEQQRVEADNQRLEAQKQRADAETQRNLAATERDNANAQAARADDEALRAKTRELLAQANVFRDSQIPRSILLALEAYSSARKTGDVALLQEAGDNVRRIVIGAGGVPLLGHQSAVNTVDWSNDGTRLLTAAVDGGVLVHAAPFSLTPTLRLLGPTSGTVAADLSPDGRWAAVSDDKAVHLWRLPAVMPKVGTTDITATLTLTDQGGLVQALTFSPDGQSLIGGDHDGNVSIWDVAKTDIPASRITLTTPLPSAVRAIAVSPKWLATIADDGTGRVWRRDDLTAPPKELTGHTDRGLVIAIDPRYQRWVATGSDDATVRLYDLDAADPNTSAQILSGHEESVGSVLFSPDSHWLVSASADTTARVWDMSEATPTITAKYVLQGHTGPIFALDISPDSRWLVTGSGDNTAHLWDLGAPDPTAFSANYPLRSHEGDVVAAKFSPNLDLLATGSSDKTVRLWPIYSSLAGFPIDLRGHISAVRDLATTSDGSWLASGSGDGIVRLWNEGDSKVGLHPIEAGKHAGAIYRVAISPDNRWLASGGQDASILISDLRTIITRTGSISESVRLPGYYSAILALAFSPDSHWLVSGGLDATVRLWDMRAGQPPTTSIALLGHTAPIRALDISPDNHWLVSGGDDEAPRLWDLRSIDRVSGQITQSIKLSDQTGDVQAVAFSPDGRWLVTGGSDKMAHLWDLAVIDRATNEVTQSMKLSGHTATIHDAAFSRDGGWLATASADNTIRLWKWPTVTTVPTATFVLHGHTGEVRTIAISADGHWLVSGSEDGTARLWDLRASDPSAGSIVLPGHVGPVWKVLINDDGSMVETAGQDAQVHLWGSTAAADTNSLGKVACSTAGRSLTPDEWQTFIGGDYRQTCQDVFPEVVVTYAEAPTGTLATPTPTLTVEAGTPTPVPTLQVEPGPASTATPRPKPAVSGPLAVNYTIESAGPNPANSNQWSANVLITASGGDGDYTYYHDGLALTGPRVTIVYQACRNKPGSFWVQDGTGARATLDYFLYAPYCNKK